ncbi:lipoprotein [Prolixibacter sp. SD074]|nr:lipoprotein [Prolixibacter sp. SD074]
MKRNLFYLLALLLLSSCGPKQIPAVGDQTQPVLEFETLWKSSLS